MCVRGKLIETKTQLETCRGGDLRDFRIDVVLTLTCAQVPAAGGCAELVDIF
jgi:hypothetical protein